MSQKQTSVTTLPTQEAQDSPQANPRHQARPESHGLCEASTGLRVTGQMERVRDRLCSENTAPRPALGWARIGQNLREEAGGKWSGLEQWSPGHGAWLPWYERAWMLEKMYTSCTKNWGFQG